MSAYLARLKQFENVKKSHYSLDGELPKPPKDPFDPFGGMPPAHTAKKNSDAKISATLAATSYECEVLNWLERIGEDDPVIFRETLDKCRANPDALIFFLGLARGDNAGIVH